MKLPLGFMSISALLLSILWGQAQEAEWPVLKGPYLGQKPPGTTAEVFAWGIVSTEGAQGYPSFTRDGEEFYYYCGHRGDWVFAKRENNTWQSPEAVPFSIQY